MSRVVQVSAWAWAVCLFMAIGCTEAFPLLSMAYSGEKPEWASWEESPHQSSRDGAEISAIIVHYTAGSTLESSVRWFQNEKAQASAHFVVGRDGKIIQMVDLDRMSWHAGKSELGSRSGVNKFSVGIEICNWGKLKKDGETFRTYTGAVYKGQTPFQDSAGDYWEPFSKEQYDSVAKICKYCLEKYSIHTVTGHSDIATPVGRKTDPGNAFQWEQLKALLPDAYKGHIGPIMRTK